MRNAIFMSAITLACAAHDDVGVTASDLATGYGTIVVIPPSSFATQEPASAFADFSRVVAGANVPGANQAWSTDNVSGTTITNIKSCDMFGNGVGTCTTVSTTPLSTFGFWNGDPSIVADGLGNVVYVSMMVSAGNGSNDTDVVALVSTDGGNSFGGLTSANHDSRFPDQCGSTGTNVGGVATIDQPRATFDYTTSPPTLWVTYRWRAEDAGTYGGCIRRGVLDNSVSPASIHWLDAAHNIEGIGTGAAFPGVGGIRVAAGDGVITVAYSSSANIQRCPTNGTAAVDWGSVDSYDNGVTWVDNAKIFDSGDFHWCVANGQVDLDFGIEITRAPGGMTYAVLPSGGPDTQHDAQNFVRVFKSPAAGIKGYQSAFTQKRSWFEWCKGTPTSNIPGGPTTNWRNVEVDGKCDVPAFVGTGPSVAQPAIATDGLGRLAVTYYETTDATDTLLRVMFQGNVNPQDPDVDWQAFPLTPPFAVPTNSGPNSFGRPLGDYMSIAVKPAERTSPFYAPGCTASSDFFPFWVQSSTGRIPGGFSEVAMTGVTLTP